MTEDFPMLRHTCTAISFAAFALMAAPASAQEAMYTDAATMPSPETFILRQQFHFYRFGTDPNSDAKTTDLYQSMTLLGYGLARDWALYVSTPLEYRFDRLKQGGSSDDQGVADLDLFAKWRFYQQDDSGINTLRAALIAGAKVPSGDDHDFSSQAINPHIGAALTLVRGRHGFNQDVHFQLNTGGDDDHNFGGEGTADALRHGSAYVFRLWPDQFDAESHGALYLTNELNGLYETNGDYDLRYAAGLMYEAWRWTLEAMVQLPVYDHLDDRPELDFAFGLGFRFSF